ncbi:MAG: phosphoribosylformylglycinamidine synthase subunit PurS [Bdellovibrionales bacterium]|nr:phosphoribosylformylglycinamidine synthase subunit PurS [Bdellovibrionales bacterium]
MATSTFRVNVLLKEGVLDVQGKAIESSLPELGVSSISNVRVGKLIEFSFDHEGSSLTDEEQTKLTKVCHELFSNPVIESYTLTEVK